MPSWQRQHSALVRLQMWQSLISSNTALKRADQLPHPSEMCGCGGRQMSPQCSCSLSLSSIFALPRLAPPSPTLPPSARSALALLHRPGAPALPLWQHPPPALPLPLLRWKRLRWWLLLLRLPTLFKIKSQALLWATRHSSSLLPTPTVEPTQGKSAARRVHLLASSSHGVWI
jgi:hypothetical protein